jgi:Tol biopolymer transport system component/imidazolonepropionase-like amidohydrolase
MTAPLRWLLVVMALTLLAGQVSPPSLRAHDGLADSPKGSEAEKKGDEKKKGLPLSPDRTIEFTAEEGTWISLDIAPDGKAIVFELLGDLYTMPIEGGEAKAIVSGLAFDGQPRYSPDGKTIAFVSDRSGAENLWTCRADGSDPRPVTKDEQVLYTSPSWTPEGDFILVSRQNRQPFGAFELWMYHVRGGAGVQVTKGKLRPDAKHNEDHAHALGAVAGHDGAFLYYARRQKLFSPYNNVQFPLSQVVRRDRTTGDEDTITDAPGSAFRPALSPDGAKLVYGTRVDGETGLRIRDLASGEEKWLKLPVQRDEQESLFSRDILPGYAFTPDGKAVVAAYGGKLHRIDAATGADKVIPFKAKVALPVGSRLNFPARVDDGPVRARLIQAPAPSPDGKRLAFSALTRLYLLDLPDGKPKQLSADDAREFHPAWSPDGKSIAYVSWSPSGGHLWRRPADGNGPAQQLTRMPAYYRDPVWSPDGTKIICLRAPRREKTEAPVEFGASANLDLVWVPSSGGETHLIAPARGGSAPHFTSESDRVYVTTPGGLLSMRLDGTDRRTHVRVVGKAGDFGDEPEPAETILMRPDGRWALALTTNQVYLLALPRFGGEAPKVDVSSPAVPLKKLTDVGADYLAWADGGKTITWAVGASLFRLPFDSVTLERPKAEEDEAGDKSDAKKKDETPKAEETAVVVERPRSHPKGSVVLRGARVITMRGDEVIEGGDVVVTDHRIVAVGPTGKVNVPEGAKVIEVRGATIVPGFVDTHAHWTEIRRGVLDLQNWSFFANLSYGVTTGRDPQTGTNDAFAYQDLVEAGELIGPRAFSTGPGVFSNSDFKSAEQVDGVVARYKKYFRTNTLKSYMIGNRRQRQWMIAACRKHGMMPTTEGAIDLKLDLTHALDGFSGNEHALPVVPLAADVVELFAKTGISYTPTLLVTYGGPFAETHFFATTDIHDDPKIRRFIPHAVLDKVRRTYWFHKDEHVYPKTAASAAKVLKAGGHVCVGSHGEMQGIGYHWEMWALASGGLEPMEVLRAATTHGAEAIGYAQDLGSLEPGKLADLVVLSKDPLEDIHNTAAIRYVMKNGELFEGDTLDRVWPDRKPLPPLWWWDEAPLR